MEASALFIGHLPPQAHARRDRHQVGGRKSHAELRPDVVALAQRLARKKPKGGKLSLRQIAAELGAQGHLNERGKAFAAKSVASMLAS